jgi:hypothetical protein
MTGAQMTMLPPPGPMPQWADCQGCDGIVVWYLTGRGEYLVANLDGTVHECPGLALEVFACDPCECGGSSACPRCGP